MLLPVEPWARAAAAAVREHGAAALGYGNAAGPGPLVDWLAGRLGVPAGEVFVTAGASHALELLCSLLVTRADTVLVDSPTYHLALRIIGDHAAALVPAPVEDPAALTALVARLRGQGRRVPLLYLVPTFNNPTGESLRGRAELVEVARRCGLLVLEDDTYRELAYDGEPPPALYSLAGGSPVVRIGSFAKTVAPGLRLGWVTAEPALVARLVERGYVHSGGGVNHTTALAMAEFGACGAYDRHLGAIRAAYRGQRDVLASAVRAHLPAAEFTAPAGGWFLWLRLPAGVAAENLLPTAEELLPTAEAHGVSYLPGGRFCPEPGAGAGFLRLSFSMLEPELLAEGVARLAAALASAGLDGVAPGGPAFGALGCAGLDRAAPDG